MVVAVFAQYGVKAVGPHENVAPKGGQTESGVVNWTGEYSTKTQAETLKSQEQRNRV